MNDYERLRRDLARFYDDDGIVRIPADEMDAVLAGYAATRNTAREALSRTVKVVFYEPWLLGWCRWEIVTDLHREKGSSARTVLAFGLWNWRGRGAAYFEATLQADPYWWGEPIQGPSLEAVK